MVGRVAPGSLLRLPGMLDGLTRVEDALTEAVRADDEFLTEIASHLLVAGGKRLRPALCLATAAIGHPGEPARDEEVAGAVAVELVHIGSLIHDDVMDDAEMRRTVESVNARWGNLKAILAGDFLLARASEIAAGLGNEVAGLLAATIGRLCEGQVRELQQTFDVARTEEQYLASITGKTASLFATACRIGALVGGLPRPQVDALTEFGRRFGMAFQIVDDVLDVVATEEQLGKPAGHDLVEGVYTLPVILALRNSTEPGLRELLGRPLDLREVDQARTLVRSDGAVDAATSVARSYLTAAGETLAGFDESPPIAALSHAAEDLLQSVPVA